LQRDKTAVSDRFQTLGEDSRGQAGATFEHPIRPFQEDHLKEVFSEIRPDGRPIPLGGNRSPGETKGSLGMLEADDRAVDSMKDLPDSAEPSIPGTQMTDHEKNRDEN